MNNAYPANRTPTPCLEGKDPNLQIILEVAFKYMEQRTIRPNKLGFVKLKLNLYIICKSSRTRYNSGRCSDEEVNKKGKALV